MLLLSGRKSFYYGKGKKIGFIDSETNGSPNFLAIGPTRKIVPLEIIVIHHSNTTLVKVKLIRNIIDVIPQDNSNTTLVKVKLQILW